MDPLTAAIPADGSRAVPELQVIGGYSCNDCPYLIANQNNMTSAQMVAGHGRRKGGDRRGCPYGCFSRARGISGTGS